MSKMRFAGVRKIRDAHSKTATILLTAIPPEIRDLFKLKPHDELSFFVLDQNKGFLIMPGNHTPSIEIEGAHRGRKVARK